MMRYPVLALLLGATVAGPAGAATIAFDIVFEAGDFASDGTPPYAPVLGDFSFSFDGSSSFDGRTEGMTVNGFTLPATDYRPLFSYVANLDAIYIGTAPTATSCIVQPGTTQFCAVILNVSTAPRMTPAALFYAVPTVPGLIRSSRVEYSVTTAAVPEPSSWAMMIAGFGLAGAAMRRRAVRAVVA